MPRKMICSVTPARLSSQAPHTCLPHLLAVFSLIAIIRSISFFLLSRVCISFSFPCSPSLALSSCPLLPLHLLSCCVSVSLLYQQAVNQCGGFSFISFHRLLPYSRQRGEGGGRREREGGGHRRRGMLKLHYTNTHCLPLHIAQGQPGCLLPIPPRATCRSADL